MGIKLVTDSSCDLKSEYILEKQIHLIPLEVNIGGEFVKDDLGQTLSHIEFYKKLRQGERPSTSQINRHTFEEHFEKLIKSGEEFIYLGLSGGLSGTFNNALGIEQHLKSIYPDAKFKVIDSECGASGLGLLIYLAQQKKEQGMNFEELITWIESHKRRIAHLFTVEDLEFLKRGGRISEGTAFIGSLLQIKPILHIIEEGKLTALGKVKGRKKAMRYLVDMVKKEWIGEEVPELFIAHGDCEDEALTLKKMLLEENQNLHIDLFCIGAVIGSHTGPGTLGVMFMKRE